MRFNAVSVDRNWGLLVSLWERDMRKLKLEEAKVRPKKVLNPEEELDKRGELPRSCWQRAKSPELWPVSTLLGLRT